MFEPEIWKFCYGSYINFDVLGDVNYIPKKSEVARLAGFDIFIRPRANLVHSDQNSVYGILASGTHAELSRLYAHARNVLGETYLPEAVLTEALDGTWKPALCYICPEMTPGPANNGYIVPHFRAVARLHPTIQVKTCGGNPSFANNLPLPSFTQ